MLRRQGLSHEEALKRSRPRRRRGGNPEGKLDALGEFAEGLGLGASRAVTSLGEGTGQILDFLGADELGGNITEKFQDLESEAEQYFTPEGTAGKAGELIGRLGGEVGTTIGTLGLGRAASLRLAPDALKAVRNFTQGSKLKSAMAATVAESPLSVARAASWSEEQGTGFGRELGIELAGSALGGAFAGKAQMPGGSVQTGRFGVIDIGSSSDLIEEEAERLLTPLQRIMSGLTDQFKPIEEVARRAAGREGVRKIQEATARMLGAKSAGQQALMRKDGFLKLDQALGPWGRLHQKEYPDIREAAFIRREKILRAQGKDPRLKHISDEQLDELYSKVMADKNLVQRTNELSEFEMEPLRIRYERGLLPESEYERIVASRSAPGLDPYYIEMKDISTPRKARSRTRVPTSRFEGRKGVDPLSEKVSGDATYQDPLEVIAQNTIGLYEDIYTKNVGDTLAELIDEVGDVPGIVRRVSVDEIEKRGLTADQLWSHRNFNSTSDNFADGVIHFEVLDDDLFDALKNIGPQASDRANKILRGIADVKRQAITLLPDFSVMSILRDLPLYAIQRATQRGASAASESLLGGAIGAGVGASTEGTQEEKAQRALTFGLAGLGFGLTARPALEIGSAARTIAGGKLDEATERFLQNSSRASAESLTGLGQSLGIDPTDWNEFVAEGGLTLGLSYGPKDSAKLVKHLLGKDDRNSIRVGVGKAKGILETIGLVAENAPRLAMYRAMRSGASKRLPGELTQEGIWSAQDVTLPFARRGSWKSIQYLSQITPFFNATLQGWAKIGRMFRGDPAKSAAIGAPQSMLAMATAMTAPTVGLWYTNKDNPEYWDRPLWERNMFWLIPKPEGGFFRIPKPFELGYVFASLPERVLDRAAAKGAIDSAAPPGSDLASEVATSIRSLVSNPVTGTLPIPAALQPVIEQAINRDLFRWKPIVPEYLQGRPTQRQTTATTPVLANKIAEVTGVLSPLRVESLLQSLGGTVARRSMDLVDVAGTASDGITPASRLSAQERFNKVTGLSRFNTQQYDIGNIEYQAYNILNRAKQTLDEYNRMSKAGLPSSVLKSYREDYKDELLIARRSKSELSQMKKLREERNAVLSDYNIPPSRLQGILDRQSREGNILGRRSFILMDNILD